jgi:hypothetical protein
VIVFDGRVSCPRAFSEDERRFIELVAERLGENERRVLLRDVAEATATVDGDFLRVDLRGYDRPPYVGHRNLPFEGKLRDVHGGAVSALVNIDQNDRLLEIEFIWWEKAGGTTLDWSTLEIAAADRDKW